ncbi:MAG: precorrin-6y C5,15-methyltransferase (decarboxylating) subunit CbiE, partial [Verrucomicrobiota bacterium]
MIISIGIGPGDIRYLTRYGEQLIRDAEVVTGFQTVIDFVGELIPEDATVIPLTYKNQTDKLAEAAALHHEDKRVVAVFMGDLHFSGWQMQERVEKACGHPVDTVPGISAAQIMASRGRVCFDETTFVTFHRRGDLAPFQSHLVHVLEDGRNAIVIPHPWDFMPNRIAAYLIENGIAPDLAVEVWENLTADEATWRGRLDECTAEFSDMS